MHSSHRYGEDRKCMQTAWLRGLQNALRESAWNDMKRQQL